MAPLTGPASRSGEAIRRGAEMAVEDARAEGKLPVTIDGEEHDFEFVWVDDQSSPEKAVRAVTEAIQGGIEFLMGGWHSSVALAVMEVTARNDLVGFGMGGESQYINEKINDDYGMYRGWFKGWPAPPIFAGLYGPPLNAFQERGLWTPASDRAGIVVEDTDFGRGWGEALLSSFETAGFNPLAYDVVPLDETEFTPLLIKYKAQNVSIIALTSTSSTSTSNFVKQVRGQGLKALLVPHGLSWFSEWYDLTGDASNYAVAMDSPRAIAPWQNEWVTRYRDRFGEDPSIAAAGHQYDYVMMAIEVLRKAGTLDFDRFVSTTLDTPYRGVWHLYRFAREAGPHALSPNDVMTGPFMEGFFFPMVQFMDGETSVIWPTEYAEQEFQQPPWL